MSLVQYPCCHFLYCWQIMDHEALSFLDFDDKYQQCPLIYKLYKLAIISDIGNKSYKFHTPIKT